MIHEQDVRVVVTSTLSTEQAKGLAIMHYNSEDPFAVALIFPDASAWFFAKSILFDAIMNDGTQGIGDVQIRDDDDATGTFVLFLSSPDGVAAVKVPTDDMIKFADEVREIDLAGGEESAVSDALELWLSGLPVTGE